LPARSFDVVLESWRVEGIELVFCSDDKQLHMIIYIIFELLDNISVLVSKLYIFENFNELEHESAIMNLSKESRFRIELKKL
jgi:hypothetical protein